MSQPDPYRPVSPPEVNPGREDQGNPRPMEKPQPGGTPPSTPGPSEVPAPKEVGGAKGLDPTRYGDWEHNGRCTDF